ncbi:MAG: branched-chain amino acid ABC transporter substrate-binding protein [Acetobacteraceae bacterium]
MLTRRDAGKLMVGAATSTALFGMRARSAAAAGATEIKIGITLPLTGADAQGADRIKYGALLGIIEANQQHIAPGYKFVPWVLNAATSTAGQYDPAEAATNARKFVADPRVMAAVGPQMSGSGKAMAPILSEGDLATITPTSTNPDLTDPKFAAEFDPSGKPIYFRTVTTDAHQGPAMANYYSDVLGVKSLYVLDDSGAYGAGLVDAFTRRAKQKGMAVLGRDRLDPLQPSYIVGLTKIAALKPDGLYYGGDMKAGVKLIKEAYDILPHQIPKGGGDGLLKPEMLTSVGFPAAQGWYFTIASPHLTQNPKLQPWVKRYEATFHTQPDDYAITAYDATVVITHAVASLVKAGAPVTRAAVRDAIQHSKTETLQGVVQFDRYGDILNPTVSIFQVVKNTNYKLTDILHQFKYIGVAPTT